MWEVWRGKMGTWKLPWSRRGRVATTVRAPDSLVSTLKRLNIVCLHGSPYCAVKAPVQLPRSWVPRRAEEAITNWSRRRLSARYVTLVASSERIGQFLWSWRRMPASFEYSCFHSMPFCLTISCRRDKRVCKSARLLSKKTLHEKCCASEPCDDRIP